MQLVYACHPALHVLQKLASKMLLIEAAPEHTPWL
jgi:hypothetical protein